MPNHSTTDKTTLPGSLPGFLLWKQRRLQVSYLRSHAPTFLGPTITSTIQTNSELLMGSVIGGILGVLALGAVFGIFSRRKQLSQHFAGNLNGGHFEHNERMTNKIGSNIDTAMQQPNQAHRQALEFFPKSSKQDVLIAQPIEELNVLNVASTPKMRSMGKCNNLVEHSRPPRRSTAEVIKRQAPYLWYPCRLWLRQLSQNLLTK